MDKAPADVTSSASSLSASRAHSRPHAWRYGASLAVMAAAAGLGSFAALQQGVSVAAPTAVSSAVATAVPGQAPAPAVRGLPDFADLVQAVGPAVVYIETSVKAPARSARRGGAQMLPFGGFGGNLVAVLIHARLETNVATILLLVP